MTAAILDPRPAFSPGTVPSKSEATNLVLLFALDRLSAARTRLVCHWHRDADGRLACRWERNIALDPHR